MSGLYKDEAFVLRAMRLGEANRIVTVYGRSSGKVRAVAKGIRRTKSRFGGRLEPFTQVGLVLYRGRGELDTVTQADVVRSFQELRQDYRQLLAASAVCELVDKLTPDREPQVGVYELLGEGLQALAAGLPGAVPAFMVKLLSIAGYHPELEACACCGSREQLTAFSVAAGGLLCSSCQQQDAEAVMLGAGMAGKLERLLAEDFGVALGGESESRILSLLRSFAEYHIERPIRSLRMLLAS